MSLARLRRQLSEYPRPLWYVGGVMLLNLIGLSILWPLTSVYIHDQLHRPMTVAGWVLFFYSGAGVLGQLTGGWLFDRLGARRVALTGLVLSGLLIIVPGLVQSWPVYVTVMVLYGYATALPFPAMNALVGRIWPAGGRRAFNFLYVANNAGVAVGTMAGGLLASVAFRLTFLGTAVISLVAAGIVLVAVHDPGQQTAADEAAAALDGAEPAIPWLPVGALLVGLVICWMAYVQYQGPLAVYMQQLGIGLPRYSALWSLNGALIVAGQPVIAWVVKRLQTYQAQLTAGTLLFVAAFLALLGAHSYAAIVGGMVLLTLGEMLLWPVVPAAMYQLAPPSRRGTLQGLVGGGSSVGRMFGPLLGGVIFDQFGFGRLAFGVMALLVVPILAYAVYGWAARRPDCY